MKIKIKEIQREWENKTVRNELYFRFDHLQKIDDIAFLIMISYKEKT
jgi:hypothetical protein